MEKINGLPLTDGKWIPDRDRDGTLHGWIEMFPDYNGRLYSIPGPSRYVRISAAYR